MRWLALVLVVGCAPSVRPEFPEPSEDDPRAGAPRADLAPRKPPRLPRTTTGTIARADVNSVLDRGPGVFLRGVDMQPTFEAKRFAGWQILSFYPDEPRFETVDLVPGDVVVGVNGRRIERPEQLIELWEQLRTAPAIEIDVLRDGEPRKLLYTISN